MLSKSRRSSPPIRPLALTMGEPASIAAEITTKAWAALRGEGPVFCLIGDAALFRGVPVSRVASLGEASDAFGEALPVIHRPLARHVMPGRPDAANAAAVIAAIEHAVRCALDGEAAGVVTNPIQKAVLTAAGFRHSGHTEFLAALCGGVQPVMLLAAPGLRTVPVTIHESLRATLRGSIPAASCASRKPRPKDYGATSASRIRASSSRA